MENLELTTEEKKELEKRGFIVKNIIWLKQVIYTIIPVFIICINSLILWWLSVLFLLIVPSYIINILTWVDLNKLIFLLENSQILYILEPIIRLVFSNPIKLLIVVSCIFITPAIYIYLRMIYFYIIHWKIFHLGQNITINEKNINYLMSKFEYKSLTYFRKFINENFLKNKNLLTGYLILLCSSLLFWYQIQIFHEVKLVEIYILIGFSSFIGLNYLLRQLVEHFHPLYAFWNIGEKIQMLTPTIESQSQHIQSEFQSDMNFSVLSDGFDSLSSTFSEIIALVIKLEKVEARANKWNLFDSEKYINSLRSDIVTPLTSLKAFLESQKSELTQSQKELTRVRVWRSEWTENIELQSKRSESLNIELTEIIEKLDVMIGKMGK